MNAVVNVIFIITILYALIEAINAANRVNQKRRSGEITRSVKSANRSIDLRQDRAIGRERANQGSNQARSTQATASAAMGLPVLLDVDVDSPLAVSVSVSGSPDREASDIAPVADLIPDDLAIPETELDATAATHPDERPDERQTIFEEIAHLRQTGQEDIVNHFAQYLDHSDSTIRVAAVFELGELAVKRQGHQAEEIVTRLNQVSQEDADPDVRAQAIAALNKVQPVI